MNAKRSAPLRVLHVHSSFDPGGKELRSVDLINTFGPKLQHSLVSAVPKAMGAQRRIKPGIVAMQLNLPGLIGLPTPGRLNLIAKAMRGYDLILTYNWGAINAVMAHTAFAQHYGLGPLVHHEDGFNADEAMALKKRRNLFRMLALARTPAVVVPSRRLEKIALEVWKQPPSRIHRIPNGVDIKSFGKKVKRDALRGVIKRPGELWLGTLAGLREVKNLPRLVRAFAPLPDKWQLVILGEGSEREAIMAEASRAGVAHRVHLPGHAPDPAAVLGLFDLFALSSDSEQFPISVVEAMAAGLAVASPAVGDVQAMVSRDNRPYITPAGDEAALAATLATLAGDGPLRGALGRANRQHTVKLYDRKTMVERYAQLYGRLTGRDPFP